MVNRYRVILLRSCFTHYIDIFLSSSVQFQKIQEFHQIFLRFGKIDLIVFCKLFLGKKMDDYVRVYYKSTGKLAIMQLITKDGSMNPDFSKTKFVTDDDLNKSLEYYVSMKSLVDNHTIKQFIENTYEKDIW